VGKKKLVGSRMLCVRGLICSTCVRLDVKCEATLHMGEVFFFLLLSSRCAQSLTPSLKLAFFVKSIVSQSWCIARSGWELSHVLLMSCKSLCRFLAVSIYRSGVFIIPFTCIRLLFTSHATRESHLRRSQ
jgi:hypothetical protein